MRVVFDRAARFVCELAEVNFEGMRRSAEHVDIRARAKDTPPSYRTSGSARLRRLSKGFQVSNNQREPAYQLIHEAELPTSLHIGVYENLFSRRSERRASG